MPRLLGLYSPVVLSIANTREVITAGRTYLRFFADRKKYIEFFVSEYSAKIY